MSAPLVIVGSGGHGKVVIATALAAGLEVGEVVDDDGSRVGQQILGRPVTGPASRVLDDPAAFVLLAIGDNRARKRIADAARCRFATLVHPTAIVHESVALGPGTVVCAGAVVQPDARIGAHGILNTGCSVDHDCVLGEFVHVAPGARLAGHVTAGAGVLFGIGSVSIPGVSVGEWSTVGAGAAVVRDLPGGVVAFGVPARLRRRHACTSS